MKETPISFSTEMVRAYLEGRKGMTRRVIKPQPKYMIEAVKQEWNDYPQSIGHSFVVDRGYFGSDGKLLNRFIECPYGQVGDRLWVRETWATIKLYDATPPREIKPAYGIWYKQEEDSRIGLKEINPWPEGNIGKWRPSIFMPRWASRITLPITGERAERLQEITEEDAVIEGFGSLHHPCPTKFARESFMAYWDSLNTKRDYPWSANNWVWVIEFPKLIRE